MSNGEGSADGALVLVEAGGIMERATVLSVLVGFEEEVEPVGFGVEVDDDDDASSSSSLVWRLRRSPPTVGGGVAVAWTRLVPCGWNAGSGMLAGRTATAVEANQAVIRSSRDVLTMLAEVGRSIPLGEMTVSACVKHA